MDYYLKKIQDHGKLDEQLDASGIEKDITDIGPTLDNLDNVVPALGIKQYQFRDIAEKDRSGNAQRRAVLRLWRRSNGGRATYRALLKILVEINEGDAAEALVSCLNRAEDTTEVEDTTKAKAEGTTKVEGTAQVEGTRVQDQVKKGTEYLGSTKPTSNQLQFLKAETGETFKLTPKIAKHYKGIAATLGLDDNELTMIENTGFDSRIDKVFNVWLVNADGLPRAKYYPLSWDGLKEILVDSDLREVATDFFEFIKKC